MGWKFGAVVAAGGLFLAAQAEAAIVIYDFSGVVSITDSAYASPIGSAFTGQLAFDDAVVPLMIADPAYNTAAYLGALVSLSVQFAGLSATGTSGPNPSDVIVYNAQPGTYRDRFVAYTSNVETLFPGGIYNLGLNLADLSSTAYNSTSIPSPVSLLQDNSISMSFWDYTPDGKNYLEGAITSFSKSAIPEPTTWAMMIVGFGLAGTALRTRARKPAYAVA